MDEDKQIFNDALDVAETYRRELAAAQKRIAVLEESLREIQLHVDSALSTPPVFESFDDATLEAVSNIARAALAGDAGCTCTFDIDGARASVCERHGGN
jgi:hypothetical protein